MTLKRGSKKIDAITEAIKAAEVDEIAEEQKRIDRRRELAQDRELLSAVAGEKSLRAHLEKLIRETVPKFDPPPPYKPRKVKAGTTRETMVQIFSDWHAYEIVKLEGTRGINEYNAQVLAQRSRRIVDNHLGIKQKLERGEGWQFDDLVVCANGDFVSGTIHEVERHTDAANIVMAVYGTGLILGQSLRDLAAVYRKVDVFGTSGNHGRLPDARKMQQKDPLRNWDTMVYLFAREFLRGVPNITWHIPASYGVRFEIGPWGFVQNHGHDIKSAFSIPYYGINRMTGNLTALEATRNHLIHYWVLSHFHTQSQLVAPAGEVFMNGSLIGGTENSVNGMGKADKPQQMMFAVHPEHGVTHRWPLYATTEPGAPMYEANPFAVK